MRIAPWILSCGLVWVQTTSAWAVEGMGLKPNADNLPWARWQGRISMGTAAPAWRAGLDGFETSGLKLGSISLMGDYYFTRPLSGLGATGGFRATSGVVIGPRSQLWASQPGPGAGSAFSIERRLFGSAATPPGSETANDSATLPYLGIGYTSLSSRGGWSLSADLGLLAVSPGNSVMLGRAASGSQGLEDKLREMRLAPVLQLGVSYSF